MDISVVVRKDKDWLIGKITNNVFKPYKQIKKLKDVENVSSYVTLKEYLKSRKMNSALEDKLLIDTGLDKIYVLARPSYCDENEWNEYWWGKYNKQCVKCKEKCKQSIFADIIVCPIYNG